MPSIAIVGRQGSGKTFLGAYMARMLMNQYKGEIDLYTNIEMKGENVFVIHDLMDFPFDKKRKKIILIDEAMFSVNSRSSSSNINQVWSMAYALFRKSNVILSVFMTHRPKMIDVNLRDQLSYIVMCRKDKHKFDYLFIDMILQVQKGVHIPKTKEVFDIADYDTHDYPLPIEVLRLADEHPLFHIKKIERKKVKAL